MIRDLGIPLLMSDSMIGVSVWTVSGSVRGGASPDCRPNNDNCREIDNDDIVHADHVSQDERTVIVTYDGGLVTYNPADLDSLVPAHASPFTRVRDQSTPSSSSPY